MGLKSTFNQNIWPIMKLPLACLFTTSDDVTFVRPPFHGNLCGGVNKHLHLLDQARVEIATLKLAVEQAGYQLCEIVRTEVILSRSIDEYQLKELYKILEPLPGEVEIHYDESILFSPSSKLAHSQLIAIEAMLIH
ncbi:hypothetical protein [Photobacterium nomapromontoriensis]|uniref:hypothetical protein n=1 Tax=Photobacterium nomapromontoriensis TaxID=2910237 RepID=UPI003D0A6141